jgi:hypothetical protein
MPNPLAVTEDAFAALKVDVLGWCTAFRDALPTGWVTSDDRGESNLEADIEAINEAARLVDREFDVLAAVDQSAR